MYPWLTTVYQNLAMRAVANRLHHGLLLHGPVGLGKTQLAYDLAALLLCQRPQQLQACGECQSCLLRKAGSHPDFHQIAREKTQISVDQIRDSIHKLSTTAQLSGNKVLIIHQAEHFNQASANALLKTLEEPTAFTYLLLITSEPVRLLPTILSRCEKVKVTAPPRTQGIAWLAQQGVICDEHTLALCNDAPLKAQSWLQDESRLTYPEVMDKLALLKSGAVEPMQLAASWQEQASWLCGLLQHHLTDKMKQGSDERIWQAYQLCIQTQKTLAQAGLNKVLLLATLLSHPEFRQ